MNQFEGLLILAGFPAALVLAGYWLAHLVPQLEPRERLALALPAGLGSLLATVAAVNFFHPLSGPWAYACLVPVLLTLALPRARANLWQDMRAATRETSRLAIACVILFYGLLLLPVLLTPATIFYDGTSNHDSFFWIAGAEHLKRHTYMELPVASAVQPLTSTAAAFVGWKPPWGRIGAEALLAMASSVVGLSPLKLYLYATASLAIVWAAIAFLVLRTFVSERPGRFAGACLLGLQPIFVFFYSNANLANLFGILTGTAAIVGVERAFRAGTKPLPEFMAWTALVALSLHGLICSYPEMIPFILLPCGLLWLRPWFTRGPRAAWRPAFGVAVAVIASLALNPATTIRGARGFIESYVKARADLSWANLFSPLDLAEYIPAIVTLSIPGAKELEGWAGWPLSALIVALAALVAWRSRDRFGLLAGLAGGAVLLGYTLTTGFAYGWQKTVQFSAVFVAVVIPVAAIALLDAWPRTGRRFAQALAAVLAVFMAYATVMNCRDIYKWSDRKVISADWFALRAESRGPLRDAPVLVEAATFRMAFFHGMWAAYFLNDSNIYYGQRGEENGGYLRNYILNEAKVEIPPPAAVLVGRAWAETFDANSPRLVAGREFALLQKSNRVIAMSGVSPANGVPDKVSGDFSIDILPHSASELQIELAPRLADTNPGATWKLVRQAEGMPEFSATVSGPPPWQLKIPLAPGQRNAVSIRLADFNGSREYPLIAVRSLRVQGSQ
jgi:hypothetical protein